MSSATCQLPPRTPLSLCIAFLSIPFGKTEPTDDDLFQTDHPPADATPPQADDAEEAGDDADADAVTGDGDGSDASEESEEVSSYMLHGPSYVEDDAQDIEFIMEPANRSLDLRCVAHASLVSSSFPSPLQAI